MTRQSFQFTPARIIIEYAKHAMLAVHVPYETVTTFAPFALCVWAV